MERSTHIVVDLGFGDAGKGTMVDAIARRCSAPPLVVRHNGGAQAGHNVHTKDGRHHTFSQFGAATFVSGASTLLSKHMIVHPLGLMREYAHLRHVCQEDEDPIARLFVDTRALVITPYHQAMNRIKETSRGASRHGTCGIGVGDAASEAHLDDAVHVEDLRNPRLLEEKLESIRARKKVQVRDFGGPEVADATSWWTFTDPSSVKKTVEEFTKIGLRLRMVSADCADAMVYNHDHVIFEGAQGVLIDEWYGFHPHTTWSTTTTENALAMLKVSGRDSKVTRIGVVRSYATRHGQGPFPSEDEYLTDKLRDMHNVDTGWQGKFRVGHFDVPLTRYALDVCPVDALAMTHCDRMEDSYVDAYDQPIELRAVRGDLDHQERLCNQLMAAKCSISYTSNLWSFPREIAAMLGVPLAVMSSGPCAEDKKWL